MRLFAFVAAAFTGAAGVAFASEPQFGRWASDARNCSGAGDTHRSAPLIVSATTLTWANEFCAVGKMYKADRALYIEGRCSSGGTVTRHPITLQMKGERLAVTWNGERLQEMQRCP